MQVSDIIMAAQVQAQEVYDDQTWIQFINAAIEDLIPVAKLLESSPTFSVALSGGKGTVSVATNDSLKTAHEVLNVYQEQAGVTEQLRRLPMTDNYSKGWKLTSGELLLQGLEGASTTDIRLDYYKKIPFVSSPLDVPEVPEQYHNLLVLYVCAKSQQKEEELNDKNDFYQEYLVGKQNFAIDRTWAMEPQNRKFLRKLKILGQLGIRGE